MRISITILAILFVRVSFAQSPAYIIEQLKDNSDKQVLIRLAVHDSLQKQDSARLLTVIARIENDTKSSSMKMKTRVAALKARLFFYKLGPGDSLYAAEMKDALYKANELDEPLMIAEYSRWYSEMLFTLKKREQAVQYGLNGVQLQEALGPGNFPSYRLFCLEVSEMFFKTLNHREAIDYFNKAMALPGKDTVPAVRYVNSLMMMMACYKILDKYDSSLLYATKATNYAQRNNMESWYYQASAIRFDAQFQLKQYDSCETIAREIFYKKAVEINDPSMLMAAYFMLGEIDRAKKKFPEAISLYLKSEQSGLKAGYKLELYRVHKYLSQAYDSVGEAAMAYEYFRKYKSVQDSMESKERVVSTNYLFAKANFEKEQLDFRKLKVKRSGDIRNRNIGIILLAVISAFIIGWISRKRKKAQQEAEKQLQLFTASIIDRDWQIEALQKELQLQSDNAEKAERVEELSRQMILTDQDWQQFQLLFNASYPGFLKRLREKITGITEAEIRLACLIKIRFNTKQMGSMQGISPNTVHKTYQRLRLRFNTASTTELEAIIAAV